MARNKCINEFYKILPLASKERVINMKKIALTLVFFLICLGLNSCDASCQETGAFDETVHQGAGSLMMNEDKSNLGGITINEREICAAFQTEAGVFGRPYLNAAIKFPEVSGLKEEANDKSTEFWSGTNEYTVVYLDTELISVHYEGNNFFGGAHPSKFSIFVTISLVTGKLVPFSDFFSKDAVMRTIESSEFVCLEGSYTGGPELDDDAVKKSFADEFETETNEEFDRDEYSESAYNFCIDEQYAYIKFYYYDALDGYIV